MKRLTLTALVALAACSAHSVPSAFPSSANSLSFAVPLRDRAHSKKILYVSDLEAGSVTLYPAGVADPQPIRTISGGMNAPEGIWVDAKGTLYVANSASLHGGLASVTEYPAGAKQPSITIATSYRPISVAVDAKGHVYVGGEENETIVIDEYARGGITPIHTVNPTTEHGFPFMGGLTVDDRGDLFAAYFVYDHPPTHVVEFAPGLKHQRELGLDQLNTQDFNPGLGRDAQGYFYVGGLANGLEVYPPKSKTPAFNVNAGDSQFFYVSPDGSIYDPATYDVYEFKPKSGDPYISFHGSLQYPMGTAVH